MLWPLPFHQPFFQATYFCALLFFFPLCACHIWRSEFLKGSCSVVVCMCRTQHSRAQAYWGVPSSSFILWAVPGSCFSLCLSGSTTEMRPFPGPLRCGNLLVQTDLTSLHGGHSSHAHASMSFKTSLVFTRINPHVCCLICLLKLCKFLDHLN